MNTEIDRFPVADLPTRYGIKRTALYERLGSLSIRPQKLGNKSYVSGEQLARLDDLHAHLQRGGGIADFLQKPEDSSDEYDEQGGQLVQSDQPTALVTLVEALASRGITVQMAPTPIDSLAYLRVLQQAAEQEWELSTSELAALLNLTPSTIRRYGGSFADSGFTFTRTGKKRGEIAWAVDKGKHK
jgi:hypothetical protein